MSDSPLPLRTVLVAGATGLVGRATVAALEQSPEVGRIVTLVRRPLEGTGPKTDSRIVDFRALGEATELPPADAAICCLGTTIRKAGSRAAFREVDHDYVLAFARASLRAGASHFLVVTAMGSSPGSWSAYNRVKGEVEADLRALGFPALTIARPSLLLGERDEFRLAETLAAPFSRFLPLGLRGIEGETVGRALVRLAGAPASGERIVESAELQRLGGGEA